MVTREERAELQSRDGSTTRWPGKGAAGTARPFHLVNLFHLSRLQQRVSSTAEAFVNDAPAVR